MKIFTMVLMALLALGNMALAQEASETVKTTRGWIGLHMQDLDPSLAQHFGLSQDAKGVLVADVKAGGPAETAGVKPGDVVQSFDGKPVDDQKSLRHMVALATEGQEVELGLWRANKVMTLKLKIGSKALPDSAAIAGAQGARPELGLEVRALTAEEESQSGLNSGAVVDSVIKGSPAEAAGIQAGDIVLELEHSEVTSPEDLLQAAKTLKAGDSVLVRVEHDSKSVYLTMQLPEEVPTALSAGGKVLTPIDIEYSTGWVEHEGPVTYVSGFTQDGQRLRSRGALQEAIDPLGDAQASQLIRSSEHEEDLGLTLFLAGGVSVFAGVGNLVYQVVSPTYSTGQYGDQEENFPNLVPFFVLFMGGLATGISGALLMGGNADTHRTAAVERYNQVVNSLKSLSLMRIPGSKDVGLAFVQSY